MSKRLKAARLPQDLGQSGWSAIDKTAVSAAPLEGQQQVDYAIVGAGFAGLSAAWRLAQLAPEAKIAILEASEIAAGPAGRNSGFMIDLPHELNSSSYAGAQARDQQQIRDNREAIDFAEALARQLDLPSAVFTREGKYTAAATRQGQAHIDRYCQHLDQLGEAYQRLDAADLCALTGSDYYCAGLYTAQAAMIQPASYIRHLAANLPRQCQLYANTPVTEILTGACKTLITPKGRVLADKVILCVNGHVQSFGFYPGQLMHVMLYASMTEALSEAQTQALGGAADWGIVPADPMGSTVRKISDVQGSGARIVVRNRVSLNQSLEATQAQLKTAVADQQHAFRARFPKLEGLRFSHSWSGRLCLSLNSVPVFGQLEDGVYSANCQNGLGTVKGTFLGMRAAEYAALGETAAVKRLLDEAPPKRLPPEPFLSIGANATMRLKEWRAGREK